nr:transcription factor GTE1-like [Tanacetum cinerariifolium]
MQLEKRLNEVEQFYSKSGKKQSNTSKSSSVIRDKDTDTEAVTSFKRRPQDASRRETSATRRMQDLMRQFNQFFDGTYYKNHCMKMWMLVRAVEDKLEHVTTALQEMATMNQGVYENDFVGRSMNDFLNIYGTVKEYFDAFKSRDGIILLEQLYEVEVFICGLPWEIRNNVRLFKPNPASLLLVFL